MLLQLMEAAQVCSPYDSAIRAGMTIGDTGPEGPVPFHNPNSRWVRTREKYHGGCEFSHLGGKNALRKQEVLAS